MNWNIQSRSLPHVCQSGRLLWVPVDWKLGPLSSPSCASCSESAPDCLALLRPAGVTEGIQVTVHVCPWQHSVLPGHLKVTAAQLDSKRFSGWPDMSTDPHANQWPLSPRSRGRQGGEERANGYRAIQPAWCTTSVQTASRHHSMLTTKS